MGLAARKPTVADRRRTMRPVDFSHGARISNDSIASVEAPHLRCVSDKLIVEPLGVIESRWIIVERHSRPVYGIVKVAGKGHNPWIYYDKNGNRLRSDQRMHRARVEYSRHFRPTEIKVGDVIRLGGEDDETRGHAWETFRWNGVLHLSCCERDVALVEEITEAEAHEQATAQPR